MPSSNYYDIIADLRDMFDEGTLVAVLFTEKQSPAYVKTYLKEGLDLCNQALSSEVQLSMRYKKTLKRLRDLFSDLIRLISYPAMTTEDLRSISYAIDYIDEAIAELNR